MPKRIRTRLDGHSISGLQAELVRRHKQRVADCEAAAGAVTDRLAQARADLARVVMQVEAIRRRPHSASRSATLIHGNAARADTTLREVVFEIIRSARQPVRTADIKRIANSMGYSVASVSTLIKFHAQRGHIRQVRRGWWAVPKGPRKGRTPSKVR